MHDFIVLAVDRSFNSMTKKWVHEKYRHKKRTWYKKKNWQFQVMCVLDLEHIETGKIVRGVEGVSIWFENYRDKHKHKEEAIDSAKSLASTMCMLPSGWTILKKKWSYIRWKKLKEKGRLYQKWKKELKEKIRKTKAKRKK